MNGTTEITIAELLATLSTNHFWVKRFTNPDERDAVIDEVIDAIAGQTLTPNERDARFSASKRNAVKSASLDELQALVAEEWPGAVLMIHVC